MLSYLAHYMNKYPDGSVDVFENDIMVYDRDGKKCVQLRKNGFGVWEDVSHRHACADSHDLEPIPKESRAWKHYGTHIGKSEEYEERIQLSRLMADHELGGRGRIPSLPQIEKYVREKQLSGGHENIMIGFCAHLREESKKTIALQKHEFSQLPDAREACSLETSSLQSSESQESLANPKAR